MKKTIPAIITASLLLFTACNARPNTPIQVTDSTPLTMGDGSVITFQDETGLFDSGSGGNLDYEALAEGEAYDYMGSDLSGYITLGDYKGLKVTKHSAVLTDEEFADSVRDMLDSYSDYVRVYDRPVEEGETVLADYSGFRDGEQFAGGTATNQTITASDGTGYIDGFGSAFIGRMPGEEFSFDVTFPENYGNAEMAGAAVTFVCTVHEIITDEEIIPELNDEFVSYYFGYSNVDDFNILYRESLEEQKKQSVKSEMYSELWLMIVDNAVAKSYPEDEVLRIYSQQRLSYEYYASYYQTTYEEFLKNYVQTTDEALMNEARGYVKEDLVMYQLIKELGVELTDDEFNAGVAGYAENYGFTSDELLSYYGEDTIRSSLLWQKLMETVAEFAEITEE